jgi:hypothetical protein
MQHSGLSEISLTVRIDNSRPVEIADLGRSLQALGRQYEEFVVSHGYDPTPANAQLFVTHVETGSIILTLKTLLEQATFLLKDIDVLAGFVGNLNEVMNFLLRQDTTSEPPITRSDAERISTILEPVAKDSGSKLSIVVTGNTGPVTVNAFMADSEKANAVQNSARRFLGPSIPTNDGFEGEVMYLQQIRGELKSKVGDRGVIEKFSFKPIKLRFMSPEVKALILEKQENPFKMAYIVDGNMSTVGGKPALYNVTAVHEAFERP